MTITYTLAPNPKWYVADLTGKPLGAGYLQAFESQNPSVQKIVYQDPEGTIPWPTTVIGGYNSILFDANGSQGPFYWEQDSTDAENQYYIRVYDINNVFQWDQNNFPGQTQSGPAPETHNGLQNLIVNSQLHNNFGSSPTPIASTAFKIAPGAHAGFAHTSSNFGPDIWFLKSNTTATDKIEFINFTLGSTALAGDITPLQFCRYTCTVQGTETYKFVQIPITNKVQNLTEVEVTFSIWARSLAGANQLRLSVAQFFGDGGSPSAVVDSTAETFTTTSEWIKYHTTFTVPSVTGKVLGSCGNDGLFLRIKLPLGATTILDFIKPCMYTGTVIPTEQYTPYDMTDAVTCSPRTGQKTFSDDGTAPFGYIAANGGSIGSETSGATLRANLDTFPLYNLLWNNCLDNWAAVNGSRGASSIADFAANKSMTIMQSNGRVIGALNPIITNSNVSVTITALNVTAVSVAAPGVFTTASPHGMATGTPIQFDATGTLPTVIFPDGVTDLLTANTTYYVVSTGASTFNLALTLADALIPTVFEVTVAGTQPNTIINTTNVITLSTAQSPVWAAGTPVQFYNTGGALPTGLSANTIYYVTATSLTTTTITVSDNLTDAIAGYFVPILSAGSGTHMLTTALGVYTGSSYTTDTPYHFHTQNSGTNYTLGGGNVVDAAGGLSIDNDDTLTTVQTGIEKVSLMQPTIFMNLFVKL